MSLKIKYVFYVLLAINIGVLLYHFNERNAFHTDEVLSYGHANSTQGAYLSVDYNNSLSDTMLHSWTSGSVFHDYLTVQQNERFRYGHIWDNMRDDVHPPLYYVLLHTVGSFFPDMFSKWHGGTVNILFFILTLMMLYKLSKFIFKDDVSALFPVFLWGFSYAGLATAMYLRMYMVQTFFAVWLMYETLLMLSENKVSFKRLALIFLSSFGGIFTQYNSLFFSFFIAAGGCIVLLWRKNWRLLFLYGTTMLLSAGALFVFFPAASDVLLYSQRGVEVQNILHIRNGFVNTVLNVLEYLLSFYMTKFLSFSDIYSNIIATIIVLLFVILCFRWKNTNIRFLFLVTLVVGLTIVYLMPPMVLFWLRYVMLIMPFAAILTIYPIIQGGGYLNISKKWIVTICAAIVLINTLTVDFRGRGAFHFIHNEKVSDILPKIQNKRIWFVGGFFSFWSASYLYMNNEKVFKTDAICNDLEERGKADYVIFFKNAVTSKKNYKWQDTVPMKYGCTDDLQFIAYVPFGFDLMFELYKVKK